LYIKNIVLLVILTLTTAFGETTVQSQKCKHTLVKIVYGKPSPKLMQLAEEEKVHLGGCMVGEDAPKYYCTKCNKPIDKED